MTNLIYCENMRGNRFGLCTRTGRRNERLGKLVQASNDEGTLETLEKKDKVDRGRITSDNKRRGQWCH